MAILSIQIYPEINYSKIIKNEPNAGDLHNYSNNKL
jgi:hypothetical protein